MILSASARADSRFFSALPADSTQASEIPGLTDDLGFSAMLDPMDWGMEPSAVW